jgi:UDP-N-acetylmuramoyl-tripeptide--D-alanyl-D-alanine ligase
MKVTSNVIWTAKDAAKATQGEASGTWLATGVSINTRTLNPGDLFIALKGDKLDGHDYVADALDKGAAAAIVSKVPEGVTDKEKLLIVEDTLRAMEALGVEARNRSAAKRIGITGSVGKTGTKEMLADLLKHEGQTHASKGSYNNHWGVPFSLASMHEGTDYGVFEMGMNHAGEISPLSKQVNPEICIITTVSAVHIENFDNEEQIAAAKAEIFDGMNQGGLAILNAENEWFDYLKQKAENKDLMVLPFGEEEHCAARLLECLEASNGSRVKAKILDEEVSFYLSVPGKHIVGNALAVLLAVKVLGGNVTEAAKRLGEIEAVSGRGKQEFLDLGDSKNPVTLIDESYNASPAAMRAAFKVLALIDPGRGGRRIAVLGDMLELGKKSPELHKDLALPLQAADVQLVYTCGTFMKNLYDALPPEQKGEHKKDSSELAKIVPDVLTPGDVVMVKGSNGSKMGVIVEALRALPAKFRKATQEEELV